MTSDKLEDQLADTVRDMVKVEKERAQQLPFSKEELLFRLRKLVSHQDPEESHGVADDLLIRYINDREIKLAYDELTKWYA